MNMRTVLVAGGFVLVIISLVSFARVHPWPQNSNTSSPMVARSMHSTSSTHQVATTTTYLDANQDFSIVNGNLYLFGQLETDVDAATFEPVFSTTGVETQYAKDKNHVWEVDADPSAGGESTLSIVSGADPATFVSLGSDDPDDSYFEDKNHIYTTRGVLVDADSATFMVVLEDAFSRMVFGKDASHVYFENELIPGADPVTFITLGASGYSKDAYHVYGAPNVTSIIDGADPATFQLVGLAQCGPNCQYDAQDKNHKYLGGEIVQ